MKVLVGIDGGAQQADALSLGTQLAGIDPEQLTVATVYAWSKWSESLGNAYELTIREEAHAILAEAQEQLGDVRADTRAIPDLSPPRALQRLAGELAADVIVVGSCGRGPLGRAMFGGVGDRVATGAPCAVAVAPRGYHDRDSGAVRKIGVAFDGSEDAKVALTWAVKLASRVDAEVRLLGVVEPTSAGIYPAAAAYGYAYLVEELTRSTRSALEEAAATIPAERRPSTRVLEGPVARALADAGEELDLLVIGSRGYGPLGRLFMGSTSRHLAHVAHVPVVVVPRTAVDSEHDPAPPTAAAAAAA